MATESNRRIENTLVEEGCPQIKEVRDFLQLALGYHLDPMDKDTYILGQGAFGTVIRYKRDYVIKVVEARTHYIEKEFQNEIKSWTSLWEIKSLRDVMPYYCWSAYFRTEKAGVIVQKYEETYTLQDYLDDFSKRGKMFPYEIGVRLIEEIDNAVGILHANGYIHRDLKPANILLRVNTGSAERELTPILIDFGMACKLPCQDRDRKGTPGFMPGNWYSTQNPRGRLEEKRYISHGHIMPGWELPKPKPHGTKRLRVQPFRLGASYSIETDLFSLGQIFDRIVPLIDWSGGTEEEVKAKKGKRTEILNLIGEYRALGAAVVAATYGRELPEEFRTRRQAELGMLNRNLNLIARRNRLALYAQEKAEAAAAAKTKKAKRETKAAAMRAAEAAELAAAAVVSRETVFQERTARAQAALADPMGTAAAAHAEKRAAEEAAVNALLNLGAVAPVPPRAGLAGKKRVNRNNNNANNRTKKVQRTRR